MVIEAWQSTKRETAPVDPRTFLEVVDGTPGASGSATGEA
jgi:hypothetical protein